jgi:hypothetical protein
VRHLDLGRDLAGEIDDDNERAGAIDGALGACGGIRIEGGPSKVKPSTMPLKAEGTGREGVATQESPPVV